MRAFKILNKVIKKVKKSVKGISKFSMTEESPNITVNLKQMRNEEIKTLTVPSNIPINDFLQKVAEEINLPKDQIRMIFRGRVLKPNTNLSDYKIEDGHTIQIVPNKTPVPAQNEDPPLPPPPPVINAQPQVTVRVIRTVNTNRPVNVTTNPEVYSNLCNVQYILSQLQLSATKLQNTILSGNEEAASTQMNEFLTQIRSKQQELNTATESLRMSSYSEIQESTTTTTTGGPNATTTTTRTTNNTDTNNNQANPGIPNIQNNPFIPTQIQDTISNLLSSIFRPPQ